MGLVKTEKELALIKKAADISNACIKLIEKSLKEDITERELARRVRREISRRGGTLAFQTLVGTGKRSGMIHAEPHATDRKISGLGYIDFGARYRGYCSDVTVPFIKGKVGRKEKRIVKLTLGAYRLAVKSVGVGQYCWQLHDRTDDFLRKHGYKMKHALGHGLGLVVHDVPTIGISKKILRMKNKLRGKKRRRLQKVMSWTFQPDMPFTIEPGIYTKRFGCRIENDFVFKNKRLVRLTNARLIVVSQVF